MAAKTVIEDEGEVLRWIEEGRTYKWMAREYIHRYDKRVAPSTFALRRRAAGLPRRAVRDVELLPWTVREAHRKGYLLQLLRAEARIRSGLEVDEVTARKLEALKSRMARDGRVIHYEPETEQGWFLVPRRVDIDDDLIRKPDRRTAIRGSRD